MPGRVPRPVPDEDPSWDTPWPWLEEETRAYVVRRYDPEVRRLDVCPFCGRPDAGLLCDDDHCREVP